MIFSTLDLLFLFASAAIILFRGDVGGLLHDEEYFEYSMRINLSVTIYC